jgi:hypothetical protein
MINGTITSSFESSHFEAEVVFYIPDESNLSSQAISRNKKIKPIAYASVGMSTEKFIPGKRSRIDSHTAGGDSAVAIENFGQEPKYIVLPDATKNKDLCRFMRK